MAYTDIIDRLALTDPSKRDERWKYHATRALCCAAEVIGSTGLSVTMHKTMARVAHSELGVFTMSAEAYTQAALDGQREGQAIRCARSSMQTGG